MRERPSTPVTLKAVGKHRKGEDRKLAECIHGFEEGFCDSCFPRIRPEDALVAAGVKVPVRRSTTKARAAGTGRAVAPVDPVSFASRRIYHVTHLRNLKGILASGALKAGATPEFDLLTPPEREIRSTMEIVPAEPLANFVPFALSPDAAWWEEIRTGAPQLRWSSAARAASSTEFVILVGTIGAIGPEIVFSDRDVTHVLARIGVGVSAGSALTRRSMGEDPELLQPEVFAPAEYSLDDVVLIGIPNEPVKTKVKDIIRQVGGPSPKLSVVPAWFQAGDEIA